MCFEPGKGRLAEAVAEGMKLAETWDERVVFAKSREMGAWEDIEGFFVLIRVVINQSSNPGLVCWCFC